MLPAADAFGRVVAEVRAELFLTQEDVAVLVAHHGLNWGREQVNRVEHGKRQVTAHEAYVLALVLRCGLYRLYSLAGYPQVNTVLGQPTAGDTELRVPDEVRARLSPAGRALVAGNTGATYAVEFVLQGWQQYEAAMGRPPTERATRAKRASLWALYEDDPGNFDRRIAQWVDELEEGQQ